MYYPPVENSSWRLLLSQLGKITSEKVVYALLFLLPIFAVTVRHWISNIFALMSLISLILLYTNRKQHQDILKEEKILLWGFAAYFGVFILTSIINGWGELQTRYLGVEIRFLLFVPLYLLVRNMRGAGKYLIAGCGLGVLVTAVDCLRDITVNNLDIYTGVYSQLLVGPVILLFAFLFVSHFHARAEKPWLKLCLLLVIMIGLFVVAKTGVRNAYLAAVVFFVLFILHQYSGSRRLGLLAGSILLAYGAYLSVETINTRVNQAVAEFREYVSYEDPAKFTGRLSSIGTRLEMWRATPIFFKDHPLFGVSRGEYSTSVRTYIEQGLVHPDIGTHSHPHNAYSETLISKGLVGVVPFILITIYPLIVLVRNYRQNNRSAFPGIILISGFLVFSLTEASPFIKGNFSSIYILFLAVLFSMHIQVKQQQQPE